MNGIIHNCTHPEWNDNVLNKLSEKEMIIQIFHYIDRLFHAVKPQKLIYLAIDGSLSLSLSPPSSHARAPQQLLFSPRSLLSPPALSPRLGQSQHSAGCLLSSSHLTALRWRNCAGVAPRAKMNQQRQRRLRTAQESKEALEKARETGEKVQVRVVVAVVPAASFTFPVVLAGTSP